MRTLNQIIKSIACCSNMGVRSVCSADSLGKEKYIEGENNVLGILFYLKVLVLRSPMHVGPFNKIDSR